MFSQMLFPATQSILSLPKIHITLMRQSIPCFLLHTLPLSVKAVAEATAHDPLLQLVIAAVNDSWLSAMSHTLPFYTMRDELSVKLCSSTPDSAVLMRGDRIILPNSLVIDFLDQLHEGHLGIKKMISLIQSCAFWIGYSKDVKEYIKRCAACTVHQTQADRMPLEPVANKTTSSYDVVAVDLTGPSDSLHGNTLLTIMDFYSRYPEVYYVLKRATSSELIEKLSHSFSKFGLSQHLLYRIEFNEFCLLLCIYLAL